MNSAGDDDPGVASSMLVQVELTPSSASRRALKPTQVRVTGTIPTCWKWVTGALNLPNCSRVVQFGRFSVENGDSESMRKSTLWTRSKR